MCDILNQASFVVGVQGELLLLLVRNKVTRMSKIMNTVAGMDSGMVQEKTMVRKKHMGMNRARSFPRTESWYSQPKYDGR